MISLCPIAEKASRYRELDAQIELRRLDLPTNSVYPFVAELDTKSIVTFFALWRNGSIPFPVSPRDPKRPKNLPFCSKSALYIQTSGTTAAPKIAKLSFENLITSARGVIEALGMNQKDRVLFSLPLFHVGGIGLMLRTFLAGATPLFDSGNETITSLVPTQLLRNPDRFKNMRAILLGGAPIPEKLPRLPIFSSYGMSEMASTITMGPGSSLGFPLPNRRLKIDEAGEIWVGGKTLFQGYIDEEPPGEWFPTRDLGEFGKRGLEITGRKDRQFISGGENIQPEEIERALLALNEIRAARVLKKEDPEFGFRPIAQMDGDLSDSEVCDRLSDVLPKFKIPIEFHPFVKGSKDF